MIPINRASFRDAARKCAVGSVTQVRRTVSGLAAAQPPKPKSTSEISHWPGSRTAIPSAKRSKISIIPKSQCRDFLGPCSKRNPLISRAVGTVKTSPGRMTAKCFYPASHSAGASDGAGNNGNDEEISFATTVFEATANGLSAQFSSTCARVGRQRSALLVNAQVVLRVALAVRRRCIRRAR